MTGRALAPQTADIRQGEPMRKTLFRSAPARPRLALAASALAVFPLLAACGGGEDAAATTKGDTEVTALADGSAGAGGGGGAATPTVRFTSPRDGEKIAGSIDLKMVAEGVVIEEAGEVREGAGHLHVTTTGECVPEGEAIPKDADHVHFGKGQLEDRLYLRPGTHELCLQVGDGAHVAQPITSTLVVHVGVETRDQWCAVSNEIDDLAPIPALDSDMALDEKKALVAKADALVAQLAQRTDLVSDVAREDVEAMIESFHAVTAAVEGAADDADLARRLQEATAGISPQAEAGTHWVESNCRAS
jgi:hypothetical protein